MAVGHLKLLLDDARTGNRCVDDRLLVFVNEVRKKLTYPITLVPCPCVRLLGGGWVQALLIGTGGINVANCYKQYGSTVSVLQV